ncbi:hypothetical protein [Spirochaeta dissipatitropha]
MNSNVDQKSSGLVMKWKADDYSKRNDLEKNCIIQLMRISNELKINWILLTDRYPQFSPDSENEAIIFFQLLFMQAATLWEVKQLLKSDLLTKLNQTDFDKAPIQKLKTWADDFDKHNLKQAIKAIRNQHVNHIGYEKKYIEKTLDKFCKDEDISVGYGASKKNRDFLYTVGINVLFHNLLGDNAKNDEKKTEFINSLYDFELHFTRSLDSILNTLLKDGVTNGFYCTTHENS